MKRRDNLNLYGESYNRKGPSLSSVSYAERMRARRAARASRGSGKAVPDPRRHTPSQQSQYFKNFTEASPSSRTQVQLPQTHVQQTPPHHTHHSASYGVQEAPRQRTPTSARSQLREQPPAPIDFSSYVPVSQTAPQPQIPSPAPSSQAVDALPAILKSAQAELRKISESERKLAHIVADLARLHVRETRRLDGQVKMLTQSNKDIVEQLDRERRSRAFIERLLLETRGPIDITQLPEGFGGNQKLPGRDEMVGLIDDMLHEAPEDRSSLISPQPPQTTLVGSAVEELRGEDTVEMEIDGF